MATMTYFFEARVYGVLTTGLTPTWHKLYYLRDGTAVLEANRPANPSELGDSGIYKFVWDPDDSADPTAVDKGELVGVVDLGDSITDAAQRYVTISATADASLIRHLKIDLSAANIASAVWDAATTGLVTTGSIGKRVADNVDAAITTRATADDVWSADVKEINSIASGALNTIWNVNVANLTTPTGVGYYITNYLSTPTTVWAYPTRSITALAANSLTGVWNTAVASVTAGIGLQIKSMLNATISGLPEAVWTYNTATYGIDTYGDLIHDIPLNVWTGYGTREITGGQLTSPLEQNKAVVNHNTGGTDALRYIQDDNETPIDGATIKAYLTSDWNHQNASLEYDRRNDAFVQEVSETGSDGRWIAPMMLIPGDYTIVFEKAPMFGPDTDTITVVI
jgi:hypothetical protein